MTRNAIAVLRDCVVSLDCVVVSGCCAVGCDSSEANSRCQYAREDPGTYILHCPSIVVGLMLPMPASWRPAMISS